MSDFPPQAYVASLAGFRNMSVHRLSALLRHHEPEEAWAVVLGEQPAVGLIAQVLAANSGVRAAWRLCAAERPPARIWQQCLDLGLQVLVVGHPHYPAGLLDDRLPPPVLFEQAFRYSVLSVVVGQKKLHVT